MVLFFVFLGFFFFVGLLRKKKVENFKRQNDCLDFYQTYFTLKAFHFCSKVMIKIFDL